MPYTLEPPPDVVASWPAPNYVNPKTRGPALTNLSIALCVITTLVVAARMYSRFILSRVPGIDDFLVAISLGFAIALSAIVVVGDRKYYGGYHVWDIPISNGIPARKILWASQFCYVSAATSVKISILLFYRRLSVKFKGAFRVATWIGIVYNLLYFTTFCLIVLLQCRPIYAYWMKFDRTWRETHQHICLREQYTLPLSGVFSIIGDFYSTILPLLLIRHLLLPFRQKMALYCLFAVGFLVVIAGIVRTVVINKVVSGSYDLSWTLWESWIWTMVELHLALICASAPALKPFFKRFFETSLGSALRGRISPSPGKRACQPSSDGSKGDEGMNLKYFEGHQVEDGSFQWLKSMANKSNNDQKIQTVVEESRGLSEKRTGELSSIPSPSSTHPSKRSHWYQLFAIKVSKGQARQIFMSSLFFHPSKDRKSLHQDLEKSGEKSAECNDAEVFKIVAVPSATETECTSFKVVKYDAELAEGEEETDARLAEAAVSRSTKDAATLVTVAPSISTIKGERKPIPSYLPSSPRTGESVKVAVSYAKSFRPQKNVQMSVEQIGEPDIQPDIPTTSLQASNSFQAASTPNCGSALGATKQARMRPEVLIVTPRSQLNSVDFKGLNTPRMGW